MTGKLEDEMTGSEMGTSMLKPLFRPWYLKEEATRKRAELDPETEPEACALLDAIQQDARREMKDAARKFRERVRWANESGE